LSKHKLPVEITIMDDLEERSRQDRQPVRKRLVNLWEHSRHIEH
jgi:hypothetical protein